MTKVTSSYNANPHFITKEKPNPNWGNFISKENLYSDMCSSHSSNWILWRLLENIFKFSFERAYDLTDGVVKEEYKFWCFFFQILLWYYCSLNTSKFFLLEKRNGALERSAFWQDNLYLLEGKNGGGGRIERVNQWHIHSIHGPLSKEKRKEKRMSQLGYS